ncbi:uncharacterized protein PGTG_16406 [Puccinia graminis f. sp. tritici CRL 75-36-700-3]|uniref:Uncharacterized protein n=1 Tax=Puccinia graminis f. sp. tritici (strain CRL 75-36-700-3 / race SCCL) TaxID=418459 RepID=E3L3U0_PUCGT|nr:uncharacterized protein PGTG_16406 [Puccinia graminis f. sp. tritici CRL 75-36-700-3]EFP91215.2 hypothetical protein PGTG_16406 [Puccinia graminis f. sp. tritici CRL 75-36-700-3]
MPLRRADQSRVSSPKMYPAHRAVEYRSAELAKQDMSSLPARASNFNVKREAVGPHPTAPTKLEWRYSKVAQPARDSMAVVSVKWFRRCTFNCGGRPLNDSRIIIKNCTLSSCIPQWRAGPVCTPQLDEEDEPSASWYSYSVFHAHKDSRGIHSPHRRPLPA